MDSRLEPSLTGDQAATSAADATIQGLQDRRLYDKRQSEPESRTIASKAGTRAINEKAYEDRSLAGNTIQEARVEETVGMDDPPQRVELDSIA